MSENTSNGYEIDIIINIPGLTQFGIEDDPAVSAGQLDHVAKEAHKALGKIYSLADNGNLTLEGKIAKLLSLELTGDFAVTHIGLKYSSEGREYNKTYLKKDFYNL